ncbi:NADPH-dependent oxidoreductase [Phytohalomonas tamaricis]|uniref:NADPH-dependent oxidoreductase n=1 Tax=Phytohalomonas tamaricis TaxID=2081032 RepID=UPI000D0B7EA6|nr:NADPH-dependent oxidoreductase [Phytohalomonas tamaricis]
MNDTIELLQSHFSQRSFSDQPVDEAILTEIVKSAQAAPTSINGQQISLVVVRDPARRARIAELAGGQAWIAKAPVFICLVADLSKTQLGMELAGEEQVVQDTAEAVLVTSVDAGITLATLSTAARSFGLGSVSIGGIRRSPAEMIELLELPHLTFPLVGLSVGHPEGVTPVKPRLPLETYWHNERYSLNGDEMRAAIKRYNETLLEHWRTTGRTDGDSWSVSISGYYRRNYFPKVKDALARQGFTFTR